MIHRNIEIALNLRCVQVQGQRAARPGGLQQIGNQLRGDWDARLVFAVLPGVAVVWQNRGDPPCRGAFERVDHQQQLEQVAIHRMATRLHHEYIRAPHILQNLKINLAIAEPAEIRFAKRHIQMPANVLREREIRGPGENFETLILHETPPAKKKSENVYEYNSLRVLSA